jgi:hypothetical protein
MSELHLIDKLQCARAAEALLKQRTGQKIKVIPHMSEIERVEYESMQLNSLLNSAGEE